jgi:hypothetical protein
MHRRILIDEFHLTVSAPPGLAGEEYVAMRRALDEERFLAELRRAGGRPPAPGPETGPREPDALTDHRPLLAAPHRPCPSHLAWGTARNPGPGRPQLRPLHFSY